MSYLVAVALAAAAGLALQTPGAPIAAVAMDALTLPLARLPEGCALAAHTAYRTNPWIGTDEPTIGRLREQFSAPVPLPDAPPVSRRDEARYYVRAAEGVAEGYSASYALEENAVTQVVALRFVNMADADRWPSRSQRQRLDRIAMGALVAVVYGAVGPCRQAIVQHLAALGR